MSTPTPASQWRRSSFSSTGDCVELAWSAVRDSKNRTGPILSLTPSGLVGLIASARAGALDR